jgi:hypothetical protein
MKPGYLTGGTKIGTETALPNQSAKSLQTSLFAQFIRYLGHLSADAF